MKGRCFWHGALQGRGASGQGCFRAGGVPRQGRSRAWGAPGQGCLPVDTGHLLRKHKCLRSCTAAYVEMGRSRVGALPVNIRQQVGKQEWLSSATPGMSPKPCTVNPRYKNTCGVGLKYFYKAGSREAGVLEQRHAWDQPETLYAQPTGLNTYPGNSAARD